MASLFCSSQIDTTSLLLRCLAVVSASEGSGRGGHGPSSPAVPAVPSPRQLTTPRARFLCSSSSSFSSFSSAVPLLLLRCHCSSAATAPPLPLRQSLFGFGPSATVEIQLEGQDEKPRHTLKGTGGKPDESFLIYQRDEPVRGSVVIDVPAGGSLQHLGIKVEMIGQIGAWLAWACVACVVCTRALRGVHCSGCRDGGGGDGGRAACECRNANALLLLALRETGGACAGGCD